MDHEQNAAPQESRPPEANASETRNGLAVAAPGAGWIATNKHGDVYHFSSHDGWRIEQVVSEQNASLRASSPAQPVASLYAAAPQAVAQALLEVAAGGARLKGIVEDNLPYLENLIIETGHESGLLRHHPLPCGASDFCLIRQARKGAEAIRAALAAPRVEEGTQKCVAEQSNDPGGNARWHCAKCGEINDGTECMAENLPPDDVLLQQVKRMREALEDDMRQGVTGDREDNSLAEHWDPYGNAGMRHMEGSDVSGGQTDCEPISAEDNSQCDKSCGDTTTARGVSDSKASPRAKTSTSDGYLCAGECQNYLNLDAEFTRFQVQSSEDKRDAERYRWLRESQSIPADILLNHHNALDLAIDAARAKGER